MGKNAIPCGPADGALVGQYPSPGLGLVLAAGAVLFDEFIAGEIVSGRWGDRMWAPTSLTGGGTISDVTPTADTEVGIQRITTTTTSGNGSVLSLGTTPFRAGPLANGTIWAAKIRVTTGTADYELWSGFASAAARVATGDSTDFIGLRSTGGNVYGVVKRAASSETVIDLSADAESDWLIAGFEMIGSSAQFFTLTCDEVAIVDRTDHGDVIGSNMPNAALRPIALGLVTTTTAARAADIDWWALGGRTAR